MGPHLSPGRTAAACLGPPLLLLLTSSSSWQRPTASEGPAWYNRWWPRTTASFWQMDPALLRQRQRDEARAQAILQQIHIAAQQQTKEAEPDDSSATLQQLQTAWLQVVFGKEITSIAQRQAFVEEYGCTGWTDEVLGLILDRAGDRGVVEIGAGNGQWARRLAAAYAERNDAQREDNRSNFDFVLAYDDGSAVPMPSRPAGPVRPLIGNSVAATIRHWSTRHRVLLLVYPPPESDMAHAAVQAYDQVHPAVGSNTVAPATILYVGEGRGGGNANAAFFDYLHNHGWYVDQVRPVLRFGSRGGHEQLYVLMRRSENRLWERP
jgi:hypothetical protein